MRTRSQTRGIDDDSVRPPKRRAVPPPRNRRDRNDEWRDSDAESDDSINDFLVSDSDSESTSTPVIRATTTATGYRAMISEDFLTQQLMRPCVLMGDDYPTPITRFTFDEIPSINPVYFVSHQPMTAPLFVDHFRFVSKFKCPIYGHVAPYVYVVWANGKSNLIHPNAFHDLEPYAYLRLYFLSWLKHEMMHDRCDALVEAWMILTNRRRNVLAEIFVDTNQMLFCSLCGFMHAIDSFSAVQRKAPPQRRTCIEHTYNGDPMRLDTDGDDHHTAGFRYWWMRGIEEREMEGDADEIIAEAAKIRNARDARRYAAEKLRDQRARGGVSGATT